MNENQNTKCQAIIHTAATVAGISGKDSMFIMTVQVCMVTALGEVFGIHYAYPDAESLVKRKLAKKAENISLDWVNNMIPCVGALISATIASAVTEAMGWDLVDEFSKRACCS